MSPKGAALQKTKVVTLMNRPRLPLGDYYQLIA